MLILPCNFEHREGNFLNGENTEDIINQTYTEINDSQPQTSEKEEINNGLIADLALILLLGAVVTLLFKKLKQPVVLGYILAGFLASPNFTYIPSISNLDNIEFWADLGIVILMFTLGLEFSFRKLMNAGSSAVMTALIIITGMTFAGFGVGKILHLNSINCIFLGGMISMSSTTIILKTLTDLGMRQKKFASLVLAVLIIEDLFAVLMLVLLSSIAVGNVEGTELLYSIGKLLFFLIIWFLVGVYVLPSFLTRVRNFLNDETMLVVSMGLCFSMAIFSVICGFSLELGAFVMGSILAGTIFAERMEKVVKPVKDLFGAVFFISVGMMVNPSVLVSYWWEILILAAVVIIGMIFFGTVGMLSTGQTLRVAIESGFTLTQVGEFSFIIASLGMSLGVLEESLYPIIVAVSVITIFTTPYFVKMSQPAYRFVESKLPENLRFLIDRYSKQVVDKNSDKKLWKDILSRYMGRLVIFSVILIAIILVSRQFLFPLLEDYMADWGRFLATVITLAAMMPFLFALSFSTLKEDEKMRLHNSASFYSVPLVALRIIRYLVALLFIVYLLTLAYDATVAWIAGIICLAFILVFASQKISARYNSIEKKFIDNLNIRENTRSGANNHLIDDLHMAFIEVGSYCPFVGDKLKDSGLRSDYGVSVASIQRGERIMPLPSVDARIFPGDILGVIGNDEQIKRLNDDIERDEKAYRALDVYSSKVDIGSITLTEKSPVVNIPLGQTDIRHDFYCMVVKVQRGDDIFEQPGPDTVLRPGDIVWLVGDPGKMEEMK
ncbi:MAG: cation:proton antiporter [Muribaculaceae bacterium]|nr:cation:proton antiporter [Muribaculaceae bacterium]